MWKPYSRATLGATLGIRWTPKFQPKCSEHFFSKLGWFRAPECKLYDVSLRRLKIIPEQVLFCRDVNKQGGSGTEPEPGTGTVGTVFPETESGTGTAGTVFQEPKPEPEPSFPAKLYWNKENPFLQRNRRNRKPEPLEPFHPRTVTEPNRGLYE